MAGVLPPNQCSREMVEISAWIYPWDIARLGAEHVLAEMSALGLSALDLAATYHAITAFSPRGIAPQFFSLPEGAVFFPARADRYRRIKPQTYYDSDVLSVWREVNALAPRHELKLNSWTVSLFQPWIAREYPDCARVMPTGDKSQVSVCPAAVDFHEYLGILLVDQLDQFAITEVKLEGISFSPFDYGAVRPRILHPISPLARWLLSFCFCGSCTAHAVSSGLDPTALRGRIAARLASELGNPTNNPDQAKDDLLSNDRELANFVSLQQSSVERLVRTVCAVVRDAGHDRKIVVTGPREPMGGLEVPIDRIIDEVGGLLVWSPRSFPEAASRALRAADAADRNVRLHYFHPPDFGCAPDSTEFRAELGAAMQLPLSQVSLYHFGLLDSRSFEAMVQAVQTCAVLNSP